MQPQVLILGAGRKRIGYHVARFLAQKGYRTLMHYRTDHPERSEMDSELKSMGANPVWFQADLSCETQVKALFNSLIEHTGRLDALVHAAGLWKPIPWRETRAKDIEDHFRANTLGLLLPVIEAAKRMVSQPEGGAITLLGDWAVSRPYRQYLAYFASKGAIPTLTRALAVELGTENPKVRVNCVEPGPAMLPESLSKSDKEEAIAATLVQREGSPENVAQAVWSFIDNSFITGTCLTVDGGRSVWAGGK